ncbi:DUF6639 family protein [Albidovulum aquaemixtae]|uniref:DUF6639 family protein n=1 Tax=Albidovulum aquaemixtae TaxID=1542388 RepID=UPI0011B25F51|nr:DUF6639 family protein [Defluviimonas aquaemixtae]
MRECITSRISLSTDNTTDAQSACNAAASADAGLCSLGLDIEHAIRMEMTANLDVAPGTCSAPYSSQKRKLQILPTDCLEEQPDLATAFPEMSAKFLFDSLIVHKLAHAFLDQAAADRFLTTIAHEYLAHAIQLDAFPERDRAHMIAKADVQEPIKLAQTNDAVLKLSPLRFAAMSWFHFRHEGRDSSLVQRAVDGKVIFDSLRERLFSFRTRIHGNRKRRSLPSARPKADSRRGPFGDAAALPPRRAQTMARGAAGPPPLDQKRKLALTDAVVASTSIPDPSKSSN